MRFGYTIIQATLSAFMIMSFSFTQGQSQDTSQVRLNTIKLNLINNALYSNSLVTSFERVTKSNQSWSAMIGYVQFPRLGEFTSSILVKDVKKHGGYVLGGEYRFYLKKENKYLAPRGVYLGPFVNYFSFGNEHTLTLTSNDGNNTVTEATLASEIRVLNIGAQLGYQFVINDRWTIDVVMAGPSLSLYSLNLKLDGTYDGSEENILEHEILSAMLDRFPLLKELITNQSVDAHGTSRNWGKGFRYQLNVGYRFGRKKSK